jgi:hypothetical protein
MGFKNVCVYGFDMNEYVFMLPAIRYVLGTVKASRVLPLAGNFLPWGRVLL